MTKQKLSKLYRRTHRKYQVSCVLYDIEYVDDTDDNGKDCYWSVDLDSCVIRINNNCNTSASQKKSALRLAKAYALLSEIMTLGIDNAHKSTVKGTLCKNEIMLAADVCRDVLALYGIEVTKKEDAAQSRILH